MEKQLYIALIADIRESKQIFDRAVFQERLESVLQEVNNRSDFPSISRFTENPPSFYERDLAPIVQELQGKRLDTIAFVSDGGIFASDLMVTLGDEFQGLLTSGRCLMPIIDHIERQLFPMQLRFGIGIGEIHTKIKKESPFGMDGPAYHIAREMITQLKTSEHKTLEPTANIKIGIQDNAWLSLLINTICTLLSTIKKSWTESQVRIMNAFMGEGLQKQQTTADLLGIRQPSVQKALASSNFYTYRYALEVISLALGESVTDDSNLFHNGGKPHV